MLVCTNFSVHTYAENNQLHYWSFNESEGKIVNDSWGDYTATLEGAWRIPRNGEGAVEFGWGKDYVRIGKSDIAPPWTMSAWVVYDPGTTNDAVILSSNDTAIKAEQWDNTGKVGYTKYGVADYTFDYRLTHAIWTHLTFVGTNSGVKLYVDGVYTDEKPAVINLPLGDIGKGKGDSGYIKGGIDEVKVFNRALSGEEIAELSGIYRGLSRGNRVLIEKGLQIQAWVTTDETGRYDLNPEDWDAINFTSPTYYEAPMYNSDFHAARPDSQWSLAKAPYADKCTTPPTSNDHFLSEEQRANIDNLVSMCFGDEEYIEKNPNQVETLKRWFDLSRELYPNVLVHNNQFRSTEGINQWPEDVMRRYFREAKPDLLTLDTYHFDIHETPGYNFPKRVADSIALYREIALGGYDGTGYSPVVFGQYMLGYVTGKEPFSGGEDDEAYLISESQINLIPFTTVTMGGKWLNYFRWLERRRFGLIYDINGNKRPQFYYYADMARELNNIGDHLVRLNSTDVYMVQGQHRVGGIMNVTNPLPTKFGAWNSSVDQYITNIDVANVGTVNNGLAGDIMVGYFEPLNGLTDDMKALFTSDNPEYFMILNGLVNSDGLTGVEADKVTCEDSKQRITLTIDLGNRTPDSLKRVSRQTGEVETVALTQVSGSTYTYEFELGGGKADLFFWE